MSTITELEQAVLTQPETSLSLDPKYRTNMYSFTYYGDFNECIIFTQYWQEQLARGNIEYFVLGFEKCPTTGADHGQGFVIFKDPVSFYTAKRLLKPAHVEMTRESATKNINYCQKSGKFITFAHEKYFSAEKLDNLKKIIYTIG